MAHPSHLAEPQINATPLIDVLLVLLIMLIFTLPIATHSTLLNLPRGDVGKPPDTAVRLEVTYDGDIWWNDERVESVEALGPRLAAAARGATRVNVSAESRAPYERVAQVLALAQRSRVEKLSVLPVADR
nr:hypothetical protein [uncultured bacterium]